MKDYLQLALAYFNIGKSQWYGWRKDYFGENRMSYENIILNDNTAIMPTKEEVEAKIQELKNIDATALINKQSALNKLKALGLTEEEVKSIL
jgi:hypothetical protein